MEIKLLQREQAMVKAGIDFFWKCWGNDSNFSFYEDCILNSLSSDSYLPNFYLAIQGRDIIGSYALLTNDLISRQDLMPWFACLYVVEKHRQQGIAARLLNHGLVEASRLGFEQLYLSTDLEGFYEKKGWKCYAKGYGVAGDPFQIYSKSID